ncbi:MAG: hypothetical protein MK142_14560, partial [Pseudomonadales bacterium]|nr:hypothetical protein [Pseudomonadales bacterium]
VPQEHRRCDRLESDGPGNVLIAQIEYERLTACFSGFGARGITAERVASIVAARPSRTHSPINSFSRWLSRAAGVSRLTDLAVTPLPTQK